MHTNLFLHITSSLSCYYLDSVYPLDLLQNSFQINFCNINEIYYTSFRNKSPIFFIKFLLFFYFFLALFHQTVASTIILLGKLKRFIVFYRRSKALMLCFRLIEILNAYIRLKERLSDCFYDR